MESMMIISMSLSIAAILISLVCLPIGIFAWIELRSFMKSTHRVQYVPMDSGDLDEMPINKPEKNMSDHFLDSVRYSGANIDKKKEINDNGDAVGIMDDLANY